MAKRTDEEKKEWHEKMRAMVKQVGQLSPEQKAEIAAKYPIVTCEGHEISGFNSCFLTMQTETPLTIIGGFRQWERAGRMVTKGNKAAGYIYVPMKGKKDAEEEKLRFRMVPVFDISQTEESAVTV